MKSIWIALAAITLGAALSSARAAPPTVTPSPGYDRRLQESRGDSGMTSGTTIYTPAPKPKQKPKKPPQQQ